MSSLLRSVFSLGLATPLALLAAGIGWVLLANAMVYLGAMRRIADEPEALPRAEVAIILGAGPGSPTLDARLDAGIVLWRADKVPRLLITGGTDGTGYGETEYMWRYLRRAGVPAEAIVVDPFGLRTLDSVHRAKRVFGFSSAIIVTQRFHLHRAVFLAGRAGIEGMGYAADPVESAEFRYAVRREWLARAMALIDVVIARKPQHGDQPPSLANHPAGQ